MSSWQTTQAASARLAAALAQLEREGLDAQERETFLVDLLADVRHYCDAYAIDVEQISRQARERYIAETLSESRPTVRTIFELAVPVDIPVYAWREHTLDGGMSRLKALLILNGGICKIDAIEVRTADGTQAAVCPSARASLDRYRAAIGAQAPLKTIAVFGREYVVFIAPSCL